MTNSPVTAPLALLGGSPLEPDLNAPAWPPVDEATARQLAEVYLSRQWSFGGPHELEFARDFAAAHDAQFGVMMANGTVTLQAALGAYNVGAGDEVIMPALTWPATAMAALYLGATPVFVDIEPTTLCLDPAAFEAAITPQTRAVIPVHIYGSMADMEKIMEIARKHDLVVIEDCAHAQGGKWDGRGLGSLGDVGSFSFQQSKTMSSGEGGICLCNDETLKDRLYRSKHIGYGDGSTQGVFDSGPPEDLMVYNFRATEFQAVILQSQLENLDDLMETYNRNAARLEAKLDGVAGLRVQARGRLSTRQSYYSFCVIFDEAPLADIPLATLLAALQSEGVGVMGTYGVVYGHILFNVAADKYRVADGGCPVAETVGLQRTACVPHTWLGADEQTIEKIGDAFLKVAHNAAALAQHAAKTHDSANAEAVE